MKISLPDSLVEETTAPEIIEKLISIINTGRAILFTGAGFSVGCENVIETSPPRAKELAKLICQKGGFGEDDDLTYASDYFLNYRNKFDLLHLLKENFTITKNGKEHSIISSLDWKRIYTTNYDDSIEKSAQETQKIIYSLTIDDNPKEFYKKRNCCIHINGSISSVSEDDLNAKFKLTRTSYVSPDSFVNSSWYYYFKKDLEQCSAIVFIGYSLYDIDIEKILFSSPILKNKTYFITEKNPPTKLAYTLSKYGNLLPIGNDGFADKSNSVSGKKADKQEFWLDAFEKYQLSDLSQNITDDQILNFILYGALNSEFVDNAISAEQRKPYVIVRECLAKIEDLLKSNDCLAVLSDFGNGKSVILHEAMATFSLLGKQVFFLQTPDGDYTTDIEKIHNLDEESILIVDDYSHHHDILLHITKFNSKNIKLIFSDRTNNHDRLRSTLIDEGMEFVEINSDILSQNEIAHFVSIIDNLGFWGERAKWSQDRKIDHIRSIDRGQIAHTLLNLFNSPQIKTRIESLLSNIISNRDFKATIFAICLLEVINLERNSSLISEVSGTDLIYKSELKDNLYFKQLFKLKDNTVISKSSLFSISLINNFFSPSYITDKLLDLAEKYDKQRHNGSTERELFKSLLRFSFAERLLPEKGKLNSLAKYYEELKVRVGWLKFDPHFWLQYGMARMNHGQLEKAQSNLKEAYILAESKEHYDTSYLDTQQARLHILQASNESDGNIVWDLFNKAHNLLTPLKDDVYKYRQVSTYKRFYDQKYNILSKKNKDLFKNAVIKMKKSLETSPYFHPDDIYADYSMSSCYRLLSDILNEI
ncbi:SIR2 family protein [Desulfobacter sp. UBA2225]|uniref:SIR2 family protein n=1 Tax=Desulfobacter sp. UBA2225 TaxID=1961413 RepID=UPI00257CD4F8|nr:SIR2 family protein [Desulfobacter sp. UBA2225]